MSNGLDPNYRLLHTTVQTPRGKGVVKQVFQDLIVVDLGRTRTVKGREIKVVDFFKPNEVSECGRPE